MIIKIEGEIGWDMVPKDIEDQLLKANGSDIDVHIASPGGFISDGLIMYNMLRDYKRNNPGVKMTATIKGVAASMASYIAVNPAFEEVRAEDNAVFMIHNASGVSLGDYREMEKAADRLKRVNSMLAKAYIEKTGKSEKEIKDLMDNETYYFGQEIKDEGFVDVIIETENEKDKALFLDEAKNQFTVLSEKMKSDKTDVEKLAAVMQDEKAQTPANSAGKNIMEVTNMNLDKFMQENPAAKQEFENLVKEKITAGINENSEKMQKNIDEISNFLDPTSKFSNAIKGLAVKCLKNEITIETFRASIAVIEAMEEQKKSDAAKDENEEIGATPGEQEPAISQDGTINNDLDYQAEVARMKSMLGLEVK